jgi:exonuclease SbcD
VRILHLADLHVKLSGPRAAEARRIIDFIGVNAQEQKPDAIVIAGDIYDRRSTPEERLYLAEFLCGLADFAMVYLINGNHDDADDVRLFNEKYGWRPTFEVVTEPIVRVFSDVAFAFLPWPNLAKLAAQAGASDSIAVRREMARAALLDVVRGFRLNPEIARDKPSILVAHMPVTGASMDSGQPVASGEEISLSADELLESGAAGVALGHIHLRQQMNSLDGRPVFYAGAPFRGSFGEAKGTKGGLIWEWNTRKSSKPFWDVTPWELPARRMVLLEGKWEDGKLVGLEDHEPVQDAEVRLRIEFSSEDRDAVRSWMDGVKKNMLEVEGAFAVTVEERPLIVSRTRCSEVAAARTTADKLTAWAQAAGVEAGLPGALAKLEILEGARP